ncbi:MAG: LacI family transcriptional regulator [Chthonomonadales bacterium]|nr:LacI family transcriptional regulator [Chthonomonadales bacterium]
MGITIRDVARAAGVSAAAASTVLSGAKGASTRVSPETRRRITEKARELGYVPHPHARSLATRRAGALGLVFPYVEAFADQNPFCNGIMVGVLEEAIREHQNIMLFTAAAEDGETPVDGVIVSPRVDGLILVLPRPGSSVLEHCKTKRFPCVTVVHRPDDADECSINADDFSGGRLATEHLIALGHRRIAHLMGSQHISSSAPRRLGYEAAMADAGLPVEPHMLVQAGFDWADGVRGLERLLELPPQKRPTAVFAANDLCAVGMLRRMQALGLRAPDDFAIVGYDDTWLAETADPPLTSVRMPIRDMGMVATRMLIACLKGEPIPERQPVLPVSLTVRKSTAAIHWDAPRTGDPRLASTEEDRTPHRGHKENKQ